MASPPVPVTSFSLRTLRAFLLIAVTIISYAALVLPLSLRAPAPPLQAGDVAPQDMQAPRDAEYVSDVRTEEARQVAEQAVQPVYTAPDPAIARQQLDKLNETLQSITAVRLDESSTQEQKQTTLGSLSAVSLKPES